MNADPVRVIVLDDSPVFSLFAAQAVASALPGADVTRYASFGEARQHLAGDQCDLVVCGFGVGDGMTANDVRRLSKAPIVLLTGRPMDEIGLPSKSHLVRKGAGPDALQAAIITAMGR